MLTKLFVFTLSVAIFAGCVPEAVWAAKDDPIVIGLVGDAMNLDPHGNGDAVTAKVHVQLYNGLTYVDDITNELRPDLAESWEISPDGKEYTFHLRKNVTFHDGQPLKASDVKFSFERAKGSSFTGGRLQSVERIEVVDDSTVKVYLEDSYAAFIYVLNQIWILCEESVTGFNDTFGDTANGTGPYKLVKWDKGNEIVLEAFDNFWEGKPPISKITCKIILEAATSAVALESGQIDLTENLTANEVEILETNSDVTVVSRPTAHYNYMMFNVTRPPFDNKLVRQAVSYAIDRESVNLAATNGRSTLANSFQSPSVFGCDETIVPYPYDVEKAKALLAEAGVSTPLTVTLTTMPNTFIKMAEVVQANLAEIGVNAELELLETGTAISEMFDGNYVFITMATRNTLLDSDDLYTWFHSTSGSNMNQIESSELDGYLEGGRTAVTPAERIEFYRKAQQYIKDEAIQIPFFFTVAYVAMDQNLQGAIPKSAGHFRWNLISWKE